MFSKHTISRRMAALLLGGTVGLTVQLGGCSQEIRTTVLGGLNQATNTLLVSLSDALFQALDLTGQDDTLTGEL